ncbi:CCDC81 family HU domain 1-containing protein, partial [Klebsiella pneumoniae]|nr:CCDC81 family HU domain 1-containing protein [Klebsiella pneumoniae]
LRDDIAAQEIDPALKAFGRHIVRSVRKGRGVHIPAMNNTAFGQVLRTLELKRAFN